MMRAYRRKVSQSISAEREKPFANVLCFFIFVIILQGMFEDEVEIDRRYLDEFF